MITNRVFLGSWYITILQIYTKKYTKIKHYFYIPKKIPSVESCVILPSAVPVNWHSRGDLYQELYKNNDSIIPL